MIPMVVLRAAGLTAQHITTEDREYLEGWSTPEGLALIATGHKPLLNRQRGQVNHDLEDYDKFATLPAPSLQYYFDELEPELPMSSHSTSEAILRVLFVLTNSKHPDLAIAADCLLALINRSEESSQAAIARKYGLTRAAISKRMRKMRNGEFLYGLKLRYFGGDKEISEQARARAIRVHNERKKFVRFSGSTASV